MPFSPLGRLKEYTSMDNTSEDAFDPLLDSYNSKSQQYKHVLSKVRQWSFYMMIILTAAILGAFCEHNWGVYRNNALVQHVSQYGESYLVGELLPVLTIGFSQGQSYQAYQSHLEYAVLMVHSCPRATLSVDQLAWRQMLLGYLWGPIVSV